LTGIPGTSSQILQYCQKCTTSLPGRTWYVPVYRRFRVWWIRIHYQRRTAH